MKAVPGLRRAHLLIHGRVQGVSFRLSTQERALKLGLTGWVRNLADGSVEALAEGPEAAVLEWVDWCRHGPAAARVQTMETVALCDASGEFTTFQVLRDR